MDIEAGAGSGGGEEIHNAFFTGTGVTGRQQGIVHAGQSDQFTEQFLGLSHAKNAANRGDYGRVDTKWEA